MRGMTALIIRFFNNYAMDDGTHSLLFVIMGRMTASPLVNISKVKPDNITNKRCPADKFATSRTPNFTYYAKDDGNHPSLL